MTIGSGDIDDGFPAGMAFRPVSAGDRAAGERAIRYRPGIEYRKRVSAGDRADAAIDRSID